MQTLLNNIDNILIATLLIGGFIAFWLVVRTLMDNREDRKKNNDPFEI